MYVWETMALTVEQVMQQDQDVLYDLGPLGGQLQHAGLALLADEEYPIAVEVALDDLCARVLLGPLDSLDLGQLVLGQGASAHLAIPGDRPLADVVLQRCKIRGRI